MTLWVYNGVNLSDYGTITRIDDPFNLPETRGENMTIPFTHGTFDVEKFYTSRKVAFEIAKLHASIAALETAFDAMRKNFAARGQKLLVGTLDNGSVRQAYARVENILDVERGVGGRFARFIVEFTLAEPFFRSDTLSSQTITIDASPKTETIVNGGTVEERNPTIVLTGPLTNPVITNTTNDVSLTYTGVISAGNTVTIQKTNNQYVATHSISGNVIGNITHSGDTALMVLVAGDNSMSITSAVTTTGTVAFEFYEPYL